MLERLKLSDIKYIDNLNDCCTKQISLDGNRLTFVFDERYRDILTKDGNPQYPYKKLSVVYVLKEKYDLINSYIDLKFSKPTGSGFKKKSEKIFSIKKFIKYIKKHDYTVEFVTQHYNNWSCIIGIEVWEKGKVHNFDKLYIEGIINLPGVEEIMNIGEEE